ncbi:unnamed protein product [Sympodiomycopsis kandeliae]
MSFPPHQGPFQVGVIDLEIPVREPRAFAAEIVPPDQINRPSKKARKKAQAPKSDASKGKQQEDPTHAGSSAQASTSASGSHTPHEGGDEDDEEDDEEQRKWVKWSPFTHGAHTSTLYMSTVLFTVYYPTILTKEEATKYSRAAWLGRPKRKGTKALVDYIGQYGIGGPFAAVPVSPALVKLISAKMPVYGGAPLAEPDDPKARAPPPDNRIATGLFGGLPPRFPVAVFSHGLAGSRLAYSQLCGELASQGVIVAAIEHRDGSGISSMVRPPADPSLSNKPQEAGDSSKYRDFSSHHHHHHHPKADVPYFDFSAVGLRSFAPDPNEKEVGMRQAQLAMRSAEIEECMHVLQRIFDGEGDQVAQESTRTLTTKLCGRSRTSKGGPPAESLASNPSMLKSWKGKLDMNYPALIGHSFGAATVMEHLRGPSPQFPYGIIYDPWVEPIIVDDSQQRPLRAPVYVISSEAFTTWEEHHEKLKKLIKDAQKANSENRGWLITVCGSEHLSFSDFPLLLPKIFRATMRPSACIQMFSTMTVVQMGLLRQRYRERAGEAGHKYGNPEELQKEQQKDETMGVSPDRKESKNCQVDPESEQKDADDPVDQEDDPGAEEKQKQRKEQSTASGSDFPAADPERYGEMLTKYTSPTNTTGEERQEAMENLREGKEKTAATLLAHQRGGESDSQDSSKKKENHHYRGVRARRTPSGGMTAVPRSSIDDLNRDFALNPNELAGKIDPDVKLVIASVKDISSSQKHKAYKLRSLIGLLYRSYGMKPGLSKPGAILVHDMNAKKTHQEA